MLLASAIMLYAYPFVQHQNPFVQHQHPFLLCASLFSIHQQAIVHVVLVEQWHV